MVSGLNATLDNASDDIAEHLQTMHEMEDATPEPLASIFGNPDSRPIYPGKPQNSMWPH